jgi:hypothetical protein
LPKRAASAPMARSIDFRSRGAAASADNAMTIWVLQRRPA